MTLIKPPPSWVSRPHCAFSLSLPLLPLLCVFAPLCVSCCCLCWLARPAKCQVDTRCGWVGVLAKRTGGRVDWSRESSRPGRGEQGLLAACEWRDIEGKFSRKKADVLMREAKFGSRVDSEWNCKERRAKELGQINSVLYGEKIVFGVNVKWTVL